MSYSNSYNSSLAETKTKMVLICDQCALMFEQIKLDKESIVRIYENKISVTELIVEV